MVGAVFVVHVPCGIPGSSDLELILCRLAFLPACCTLQELAVEDMRHELDDEGRREFFEEQEEDAEGGSRAGNERCVSACIHPQ